MQTRRSATFGIPFESLTMDADANPELSGRRGMREPRVTVSRQHLDHKALIDHDMLLAYRRRTGSPSKAEASLFETVDAAFEATAGDCWERVSSLRLSQSEYAFAANLQ